MGSRFAPFARLGAVIGICAALVVPCVGVVAGADGDGFGAVDAAVRSAAEASGVPGIAYALVRDGAVLHEAAFGVADGNGRPMTTDTPLVVGSVGKSITALAIRQLVDAGRVELGAPASRYLPRFQLAGGAQATDSVTVRSLLEHTSGLSTADGQDPAWYVPGRSPDEVINGLARVAPDRAAGTYEYSNLNYVILGAIVQAVSGQAYGDYVQTHVFDPLDMRRSFTDLDASRAAGLAQGYRYVFGMPIPFDEPYPTGMVAVGYQISTARDMARFVAALSNGGVLGDASMVRLDGRAPAQVPLGTDWQEATGDGATGIITQSGSTLATNAVIAVLPASRLGVVVLMNANPTQLLGVPAGAAEIGLQALFTWAGVGRPSAGPSVRTVFVVLDLALLIAAALLVIHAIRARTWARRWRVPRGRRALATRTVVADLCLPLLVLIGVPLWIGSTGSTRAGDPLGGWSFAVWTLPDVSIACLAMAVGALAVGAFKVLTMGLATRRPPAPA